MKWIPVLILFACIACDKPDPVTIKVDEYLKTNLEVTDRYRFVGMHKHDSFTYRRLLMPVVRKTADDSVQHALMRLYTTGPVDSVLDYVYRVKYEAMDGDAVRPKETFILMSPDGTIREMEDDYAVMLLRYYESQRLNDLPGYKAAYNK